MPDQPTPALWSDAYQAIMAGQSPAIPGAVEREQADESDDLLSRFTNALDCCGTCAGGVLARHVRESKAQELRDAVDRWCETRVPDDVGFGFTRAEVADWFFRYADGLTTPPGQQSGGDPS